MGYYVRAIARIPKPAFLHENPVKKKDPLQILSERQQIRMNFYTDTALGTLKHEFIDYAISQLTEPYKEVTNKLISFINEDAYRRKEKVVEARTRLIGDTQ